MANIDIFSNIFQNIRLFTQALWVVHVAQNILLIICFLDKSRFTYWLIVPIIPAEAYIIFCIINIIAAIFLFIGIYYFRQDFLLGFLIFNAFYYHLPIVILVVDIIGWYLHSRKTKSIKSMRMNEVDDSIELDDYFCYSKDDNSLQSSIFWFTLSIPLLWIFYWTVLIINVYKLWVRIKEFDKLPNFLRTSHGLMRLSRSSFRKVRLTPKTNIRSTNID